MQQGHILKKQKLKLQQNKVVNHRFIPKSLDLIVVDWGFKFSLDFSFDDSGVIYGHGKYRSIFDAIKVYENLAKANKEGKLYVHVYGDGKTRLEIGR